jgi:MtN3 and saliva related transmembrane protein
MDSLVRHHILKHKKDNAGLQSAAPQTICMYLLEKTTLAAGVIGPVMTIPQIYKIYFYHSAAGVSLISWLSFGILDIPFLLYGIVHKDKPIVTTYILWMVANFTVAIGAIVFR